MMLLLNSWFVSDIAIFVLKRDIKLQPTNSLTGRLYGTCFDSL